MLFAWASFLSTWERAPDDIIIIAVEELMM